MSEARFVWHSVKLAATQQRRITEDGEGRRRTSSTTAGRLPPGQQSRKATPKPAIPWRHDFRAVRCRPSHPFNRLRGWHRERHRPDLAPGAIDSAGGQMIQRQLDLHSTDYCRRPLHQRRLPCYHNWEHN
jgi:hypothetical protein